jgi:thiol-disulfide isomerase/thioredoxin
VNDLAPDFELATPTGEKVKLSSLKGSVVVLDFWGTWCLPCRQAAPEVQKLSDTFKDKGVKVFGLAVREKSDQEPTTYWQENKHTYGLLLKADDVAKTYKVRMYPTYVVIGKEGEIVHIAAGYEPGKTMPAVTDAVERALAGAPAGKAPVTTSDEKTVKGDK